MKGEEVSSGWKHPHIPTFLLEAAAESSWSVNSPTLWRLFRVLTRPCRLRVSDQTIDSRNLCRKPSDLHLKHVTENDFQSLWKADRRSLQKAPRERKIKPRRFTRVILLYYHIIIMKHTAGPQTSPGLWCVNTSLSSGLKEKKTFLALFFVSWKQKHHHSLIHGETSEF